MCSFHQLGTETWASGLGWRLRKELEPTQSQMWPQQIAKLGADFWPDSRLPLWSLGRLRASAVRFPLPPLHPPPNSTSEPPFTVPSVVFHRPLSCGFLRLHQSASSTVQEPRPSAQTPTNRCVPPSQDLQELSIRYLPLEGPKKGLQVPLVEKVGNPHIGQLGEP